MPTPRRRHHGRRLRKGHASVAARARVEGCAYEAARGSSPGLDRPLRKAADYVRFAGEQVEVTLKRAVKGRKKYRGELQALESEGAFPARAAERACTGQAGRQGQREACCGTRERRR